MKTKFSYGLRFFAFILALAGVILSVVENKPIEMIFHLTILVILGYFLFGDNFAHSTDNED